MTAPVVIHLKRYGGFAGLEQHLGSVDTATLGTELRQEVETHLLALTRLVAGHTSPGADRLEYEVEVLAPGQHPLRLIVPDEGDPDQPELQALSELAFSLGLAL